MASELSAFHLREDMGNTLVIAIAQSGTTIDTNVSVKMAKERGAYTLAILNKRQGDISYLVDTTLYLGNGRDIEIAVPSTKTYTAQVVLGYIVSLYLACNLEAFDKNIVELMDYTVIDRYIINTMPVINKQQNLFFIEKKY